MTKQELDKLMLRLQRGDESAFEEMSPVTSAMNKVLNEDERQIVTLHAISGFKHREIADMLDKPLGTVVWSYNNALSKLKKELQKEDEE